MNLAPGSIIGGFSIIRLIGEGGMSEVYLVQDNLDRQFALKTLSANLSRDSSFRERFKQEAKIMSTLHHPNIVQLHSYFEEEDTFCLVMEYVEGGSLKDLIKEIGPIPESRALNIFSHVADALSYAHDKGVIHRDIKPSNIMLGKDDEVKVMDFGIARMTESPGLTKTGTQMGTLVYMSPEQIRDSKHIDSKSDVYSLGVTLYEMLTGKAPYDESTDSDFDIREKIVYKDLPYSKSINSSLRSDTADMVVAMTRKEKDSRISLTEVVDHTNVEQQSIESREPEFSQLHLNETRVINPVNSDAESDVINGGQTTCSNSADHLDNDCAKTKLEESFTDDVVETTLDNEIERTQPDIFKRRMYWFLAIIVFVIFLTMILKHHKTEQTVHSEINSIADGTLTPEQLLTTKPNGFVNDFANVITPSTEQALTEWIVELKEITTIDMAIVTIESIGDHEVMKYATELYNSWGVGNSQNEGAMILIATNQHKWAVIVGLGSESYLLKASQNAFSAMRELLKEEGKVDYDKSIIEGFKVLLRQIQQVKGVLLRSLQQNNPQIVEPANTTQKSATSHTVIADQTEDGVVQTGIPFNIIPAAILNKYNGLEIQRLAYGLDSREAPSNQADLHRIDTSLNHYKTRLVATYRQYSQPDNKGTLIFDLYISETGKVEAARIIPSGSFKRDFINKVEAEVLSWGFSISNRAVYRWTFGFY